MSLVYQGLWNVETHLMAFGLQGFGTFISIFNFLVFAVLACSTAFSISTRSQHWKDVWPLQVGLGLLSGWYLIHTIDSFLRDNRARVTYSYMIVPALFDFLRFTSDISVFFGLSVATLRHRQPDVFRVEPVYVLISFAVSAASCLWLLGVYHFGLNLSLCFTWLGFAELGTIKTIAEDRALTNVIFASIYFLSALVLLINNVYRYEKPKPLVFNYIAKDAPSIKRLMKHKPFILYAASLLWARSFSELVVVGYLMKEGRNVSSSLAARDMCYGLFSAACAVMAAAGIPRRPVKALAGLVAQDEDSDPWMENREEEARKRQAQQEAAERNHQMVQAQLNAWFPELRELVLQRLMDVTDGGRSKAPPFTEIMDDIGDEIRSGRSGDSLFHTAQMKEVERMKEFYGPWRPILKGGLRKVQ